MLRNQKRRWTIVTLLVAWCFDQLFWNKDAGISFFIIILLCVGAGVYLTLSERLTPSRASLVLILPVIFFSGMTAVRREPFTLAVNILSTVLWLYLLGMTWLGGRWPLYTITDYLSNGLRLFGLTLIQPAGFYTRVSEPAQPNREIPANQSRLIFSVLLGLTITLPVILVLGQLLVSADPIFARQVEQVLRFFRIERLAEYLLRITYICILAYFLSGVIIYAVFHSRNESLTGRDKPWLKPFLGWLEAGIVILSTDLLFLGFLVIQFQYFFGGRANINLAGFTYAEYARRGFSELVTVACLSLILLLSLSLVTRRQNRTQRRIFSSLSVILVVFVAVILVSAFQRLLLYEAAYGFTRARLYAHNFMLWLGILLLVIAGLELSDRLSSFALALVLSCMGFGMTVNMVNVDALIARQNIGRAIRGAELDVAHLAGLSSDAVPFLFDQFMNIEIPEEVQQQVGAALVCWQANTDRNKPTQAWPSWHWSRERAQKYFVSHKETLSLYKLEGQGTRFQVIRDGNTYPCTNSR